MFNYFGYGSNINLHSLRAKGVVPVTSVRAILYGWRLRFNVQHWFSHEGGVANIEQTGDPHDLVEGILHTCRDEELASLDAMESFGLGYDRIEVTVTADGGPVPAQTYVGLPGFIDDTCLPSRRYLNIILKGATEAGLPPGYLEKLRHQPVQPEKDYPAFQPPPGDWPFFDRRTLAMHPTYTALAGAVFDMADSGEKLEGIIGLLGGRDMTLFLVRRHDTSRGDETASDLRAGSITPGAKKYINAYLHEYSRVYRYAGRYSDDVEGAPDNHL